MNLEACLPDALRSPATTITRVRAGLSGAGVYRVEAGGQVYVLKVATDAEPASAWREHVAMQQQAAAAGLAPAVVHVDEARHAVVSAFVVDRSFPALFMVPGTRDAAITLLGRTLRRVHDLPVPAGVTSKDPRTLLTATAATLATVLVPMFVTDAITRVLDAPVPAGRPTVLCHNDVNPTNLCYDGERLLLLDWDTAGPGDPLFDLAAAGVFLRMDDATCQQLVAAHDGAPIRPLPGELGYYRQLIAVMCGAMFLELARQDGHPGSIAEPPSLGAGPARVRTGPPDVSSAEGKWAFGLSLIGLSAPRPPVP